MSVQKITPFLWFNNNAEEAINFYVSVFPNSRVVGIKRYPDGPLEGPMAGFEGKVLTGVFELFGQRFMALDGGDYYKPTGAVSMYVECETQEEIDTYWRHLTKDGGQEEQCGWLRDRFGFYWQIIPSALSKLMNDPDPARAARVTRAMLQMKKLDIVALETA